MQRCSASSPTRATSPVSPPAAAAIKIDISPPPGYAPYLDGLEKGVFVKGTNGDPYVGQVRLQPASFAVARPAQPLAPVAVGRGCFPLHAAVLHLLCQVDTL